MNIRESSHGYWTSSQSFLWVAAGATVGISNLTRVPYLMGEYGGAAFLLVYVLSLIFIAVPLVAAEWMLGRWTRDDLIAGFQRLAEAARAHSGWKVIGVLAMAGAVLILSYYSIIAGWSIAYMFRVAGGGFGGMSETAATEVFLELARDPERSLSWHTIFMVVVCIVVAHGFREGIERTATRLMPAAAALIMALCAYAVLARDAGSAVRWLLAPDFSQLGWRGVIEAMNQAFFTMSLGIGVMMNLGVYLPVAAPVKRLALTLMLIDLCFSLLGGIALFTVILAAGLQPAPGLALIFQVLPRSLPQDLGGTLFGVGFFLTLFLVALSSATVLLEPLTRYLIDRLRWTRVFAAASSALIIWYLGLGSLLSFNVLENFQLWGNNFFEWVRFLTASVFAPATGLLICVFVVSIMPRDLVSATWGERDRWLFQAWFYLLRYPARIGLIVILCYASGLLNWLVGLWA
ncbi:sodium-dependent transporter [Fontimonas sp. SYSU GA230001]|uniref:sodium-dependent transporter n=1 Tax=Fontimonas sp. SYSU GA230001 TaxID=3142450 RepID=UPI0032B5E6AC